MKSKILFLSIIPLFLWLLTSCSGSSSSSGGGTTGSSPSNVTYSQADEEGTWDYTAIQVTSGEKITGIMTFNKEGRLTDFNSSKCPDRPYSYSEFWYMGDGWVKGRIFGFCGDPDIYIKFGLHFSNKYTMAGDMDVHYAYPNEEETYQRYSITLKKPTPPPPPIVPESWAPTSLSNTLSKQRR
jgi:hypothetical protein